MTLLNSKDREPLIVNRTPIQWGNCQTTGEFAIAFWQFYVAQMIQYISVKHKLIFYIFGQMWECFYIASGNNMLHYFLSSPITIFYNQSLVSSCPIKLK